MVSKEEEEGAEGGIVAEEPREAERSIENTASVAMREPAGRRVSKLVGEGHDRLSFGAGTGEELEKILELTWTLILHEALRTTGLCGVPAEIGLTSVEFIRLGHEDILPGLVDQRLVKKAVDDPRVHPVRLGLSRLKMPSDVLDMAFSRGVKGRAEAASPILSPLEIFDHLL